MKVAISSIELEILRKSAEGLSVNEIARELNLSQQVISKSHKDILSRTGSGTPVNALQSLARYGFVLTEDRLRS